MSSRPRARERRLRTADGVELARLELGAPASDAVLLVHGFSQNRQAFLRGEIPDRLVKAGFQVVLAELRGHGASERPVSWGLAEHLHFDLPALLGSIEADRVHYVGHSMGGMLGYAALGHGLPIASMTGLAAPLALGTGAPLVRLAALGVGLAMLAPWRRSVRVDLLLKALSGPLADREASVPLRAVQRLFGLANPRRIDGARIQSVLAASDSESVQVFRELLRMGRSERSVLAGVDLVAAVRAAPVPVAAVMGARDVLAPPASVRALEAPGQSGPRRLVVLPAGAHVDLSLGGEVAAAIVGLEKFWKRGIDRPPELP